MRTEGQGRASIDTPKKQHLPPNPCTETSSSTTHSTTQGSFLHVMFGLMTVSCKTFSSPLGICGHLEAAVQETPSRGEDKHDHSRAVPAVQEHPKHRRGHKHPPAVLDLRHCCLLCQDSLYRKLLSQRNFTVFFSSKPSSCQSNNILFISMQVSGHSRFAGCLESTRLRLFFQAIWCLTTT